MKYLLILISALISFSIQGRTIDTLINVGKYNLHFIIITGSRTPILFEAGGDNVGAIWGNISIPVAEVTGATVIMYDRPGIGKSGKDSTDSSIENEIKALEMALVKLGYQNEIMLVSHSLGGFYNTIFTSRQPKKVKAIVFIDANLPCFFTEEQFVKMKASQQFRDDVDAVRKNPLPGNIPLVDIVSEKTLFEGTPDAARWKSCHHDFVAASSNRKELVALATGHYVFLQNSPLVINSIVTMYANYVEPARKASILEKAYAQAQNADNENRKKLMNYWHSEDDMNEWGYSFYQKNEMEKALEIFKLNVMLHPESANVYDSLADAYLKSGNKELAIKNYQKALELDPQMKSARKALDQLLK